MPYPSHKKVGTIVFSLKNGAMIILANFEFDVLVTGARLLYFSK